MKGMRIALGAMLSSSLCASAMAQEATGSNSATDQEAAGLLRDRANERNAIETAMAPIKSRVQLDQYVRDTPTDASPLNKSPPQSRKRFLDSLTFNDKGVTGFDYRDLQAELTTSEIHAVLSLFGAQRDTALVGGRNGGSSSP